MTMDEIVGRDSSQARATCGMERPTSAETVSKASVTA